jgi:hypothetical protein
MQNNYITEDGQSLNEDDCFICPECYKIYALSEQVRKGNKITCINCLNTKKETDEDEE